MVCAARVWSRAEWKILSGGFHVNWIAELNGLRTVSTPVCAGMLCIYAKYIHKHTCTGQCTSLSAYFPSVSAGLWLVKAKILYLGYSRASATNQAQGRNSSRDSCKCHFCDGQTQWNTPLVLSAIRSYLNILLFRSAVNVISELNATHCVFVFNIYSCILSHRCFVASHTRVT